MSSDVAGHREAKKSKLQLCLKATASRSIQFHSKQPGRNAFYSWKL